MTTALDPEAQAVMSNDRRDINSQPVLALLEALVGPEGATATLAAAGVPVWATMGELTEAETVRVRLEVVRRCAVAPGEDEDDE